MNACRTVPVRFVCRWCERQWAISITVAFLALCAAVALVVLDRYMLGAMAGFAGACATGAAVMAAHIGKRFME